MQHNWDGVKHIARHPWTQKSSSPGVEQGRRPCSGCVMRNTLHPVGCCTNTKASRTQGMQKHPQVLPLPQKSREIKMPSPKRQSCAVFRQADLGGILWVESIFQVARAVGCRLISKLPGKHLHVSSVVVFLPHFVVFYCIMLYLANVTCPTAT